MRKYGNKKVKVDGYSFDSKMECDYYYYLKIKKDKKEIREFKVHEKIVLQPSFKYKGKTIKAITYTTDFLVFHNNGNVDYVDIKGVKTNEFKIKEKMLKYSLRDINNYDIYCLTLCNETWVKL